jgi:protoheme IX farnesyltransferase
MKVATMYPEAPVLTRTRVADYLELTKPRVMVLVLFTVAVGAWLAPGGGFDLVLLFHTLFGTALVAAGASALNQFLERQSDARMRRTENRPLPSGRLQPGEVLAFGIGLGIGGVAYLALTLPRPWAALVAACTFVSYVFVYTPLKRRTVFNTLVGAVPGALPPVIGYTAMPDAVSLESASLEKVGLLFLVVFLWQIPHFLAIAWIYREDYARAGLKMLPVLDRQGIVTGRRMVAFCCVLIPASLAPAVLGLAGPVYFLGAALLGVAFLASAVAFWRRRSVAQARRVLRASLVFLPALLALLLLDGLSNPLVLALWP